MKKQLLSLIAAGALLSGMSVQAIGGYLATTIRAFTAQQTFNAIKQVYLQFAPQAEPVAANQLACQVIHELYRGRGAQIERPGGYDVIEVGCEPTPEGAKITNDVSTRWNGSELYSALAPIDKNIGRSVACEFIQLMQNGVPGSPGLSDLIDSSFKPDCPSLFP